MAEELAGGYTLVSGATGYLGRAFVFECAKAGASLFLTGRSEEKLAALRAELAQKFPRILADSFACDLTEEGSRAAMFSYIKENGYRIARLCNVAGADIQKAFEKYTQEKLVFQCRVNFEAAVSLTKFALENRAEELEIVTVASISGGPVQRVEKGADAVLFRSARGMAGQGRADNDDRAGRHLYPPRRRAQHRGAGDLGQTFGEIPRIYRGKEPRGGAKKQAAPAPRVLE